ncbi:hypothetical protein [Rhodococcus triatomae]
MTEPSVKDLIASVIEAGTWYQLRIVGDVDDLSILARRDVRCDPPIRFAIDARELGAYYHGCVSDVTGDRTPWQQWMILMPTHLQEALYRLDQIDGPARIVITGSGFEAVPAH